MLSAMPAIFLEVLSATRIPATRMTTTRTTARITIFRMIAQTFAVTLEVSRPANTMPILVPSGCVSGT